MKLLALFIGMKPLPTATGDLGSRVFLLVYLVVLRTRSENFLGIISREHYTKICTKRNEASINICEFAVESGTQNQVSFRNRRSTYPFEIHDSYTELPSIYWI